MLSPLLLGPGHESVFTAMLEMQAQRSNSSILAVADDGSLYAYHEGEIKKGLSPEQALAIVTEALSAKKASTPAA